ncbi:hypothetical protein [Terracidiphilus gabretensis]|jgi:hypothetical protein|uniref:hypothetical protein n=1 Tax=Terracidiphilus gabretensis TaxID=1577687 RepID=UPI00071BC768|nr:hypothetical protein [Terracidiphilus gabretensis]
MKLIVLGSVFCAAAMAAGQSANEKSLGRGGTIFQLPQGAVPPDHNSIQLPNIVLTPRLDEGIIVHPPAGSFVLQSPVPPAAQAQKLYPGLKLLPTDTAKLEAIPLEWPKFKMEQIPTQWQGMKVISVKKDSAANTPSTASALKKK